MPEIKVVGDSPTTEDGLGFDSYVDILLDAINNFDVESPLTIGIHGSWGSGKTSLMRMLEKRFEKDKSVKTIWFNAWRYSKEDIIWRAFIMKLLYKLGVFQNLKEADWLKVFGELIKPFFSSNPNLGDMKEAFSYGQRIDTMDEFEEGFKKIVRDVVKDGRLIIFIDDLDRCLPEKTIEILEVIKLFLDVPRCVFVIGVEKEVIERGIEVRYKSGEQEIPISGKDYIEKIIQIPFTLPPIREEDMTRFIESQGIGEKEKEYAKIVAKVTGCNPRKVKTFLNTLRIREVIAEKRTGEGIKPELFVKLYATEYTFPEFYKDVVKYRGRFLSTLERLAKGDSDEGLRKELDGSVTLQTYYKNEKIKNLLKDKPFFYEIEDIEPYIYLSGAKAPEEVSGFDESVLEEVLSGDWVKTEYAANTIKEIPDSDKQHYLDEIKPKLKDKNVNVRERAAMALGMIGDAEAVEPLIEALNDEHEDVRNMVEEALGMIYIELLRSGNVSKFNALRDRKGITDLDLIGVDLTRHDTGRNNLSGVNFHNTKLIGTNLRRVDLIGADLDMAVLNKALLSGANLKMADLSGAHLIDAHLIAAILCEAVLIGVDLSMADLRGANLSQGIILVKEPNYNETNVKGADFSGAIIGDSKFLEYLRKNGAKNVPNEVSTKDVIINKLKQRGLDVRGIDQFFEE